MTHKILVLLLLLGAHRISNVKLFSVSNMVLNYLLVTFIPTEVLKNSRKSNTAWKVSKYGVFSRPDFLIFSPNTGKYGPEKPPHLDAFYPV